MYDVKVHSSVIFLIVVCVERLACRVEYWLWLVRYRILGACTTISMHPFIHISTNHSSHTTLQSMHGTYTRHLSDCCMCLEATIIPWVHPSGHISTYMAIYLLTPAHDLVRFSGVTHGCDKYLPAHVQNHVSND